MSLQSRQNLPLADTQAIDQNGRFSFAWMQFFLGLFNKTGGGQTSDNTICYVQQDSPGVVGVYLASSGVRLGTVTLT